MNKKESFALRGKLSVIQNRWLNNNAHKDIMLSILLYGLAVTSTPLSDSEDIILERHIGHALHQIRVCS